MASAKKNAKSFIVFFFVILIAIGIGYSATKLQKNIDATPQIELTEEEKQQQKAIKNADYIISPPNEGSLYRRHKITINYLLEDKASASIESKYLDEIKIYQSIILYDKDGVTMPLGGKIEAITPRGDTSELSIKLPEGTQTQYLSNDAHVMTLDARSSLRFPLSALQKDKNGNHYVWLAEKTEQEGKFQAIKHWVENPFFGEGQFVAGRPVNRQSFVILEPDKKIKNNEIYKMVEVQYQTQYYNPIMQAYRDYRAQQGAFELKKYEEEVEQCRKDALKKKIANAMKADDKAQSPSSSCGAGGDPSRKPTPVDIFNSILSRQPGNVGKGCGAPAACGAK